MKERPILFSAAMVRAILEGRKTQTRRIVKASVKGCTVGSYTTDGHPELTETINVQDDGDPWTTISCPYGEAGDRLWVRETWANTGKKTKPSFQYRADGDHGPHITWKPSIHMPREASRITLEVLSVRVEPLWEITGLDAFAEGVIPEYYTARDAFVTLWDSINAKRGFGWKENPLVWVVEFKQVLA